MRVMSINYRTVMASLKEKVSRRISTNALEKSISDKQGILRIRHIDYFQKNELRKSKSGKS